MIGLKINYGLKPFWFWNGEMKDDEIARQIREMSEKGIGGFFIHPRQGLTVPYMSDQWFEKVGVAINEAKKTGLEAWLYDEYPYPSGIAGGEVICGHPELEAKLLHPEKLDVEGPSEVDMDLPWGSVLMAYAYRVAGEKVQWDDRIDLSEYIGIRYSDIIYQESSSMYYNFKRFFGGDAVRRLHWEVPEGKWRIYIFLQVPVKRFKYYGTFIDPLNPATTERFIQTTHEKYRQHFGSEFGKTIKGIFCDETGPNGGELPWSPILPQLFEQKNGYSLIERLPALMERMGGDTDRIRYDYWNTVVNAFIENFDMKIHNWCLENNLLYVGEKPILRSSQLKHMDIPGVDAGHQKAGDNPIISDGIYRHSAKVASSAAHFYKKDRVLCEAFHSAGWSMTHQDMKWTMDWLSLCGVDMFVPHGFFYTTDGLKKHDAPPSMFFQIPAWKHTALLSDYMNDMWKVLSSGSRKVDILVMDPVTSTWTAMGEKKHLRKKIFNDFAKLQKIMLQQHLDYYVIDPELLAQSEVKDGCLSVNGEVFRVLVVPPVLNIDEGAAGVIGKYLEQGGVLVTAGCLPFENIDSHPGTAAIFNQRLGLNCREIYDGYTCLTDNAKKYDPIRRGNTAFVQTVEEIPGQVRNYLPDAIRVLTDGKPNESIYAAQYDMIKGGICHLINISGHTQETKIMLKYEGDGIPVLQVVPIGSTEKGQKLDVQLVNGYLTADLHFHQYQSYVLRMGTAGNEVNPGARSSEYHLDLNGTWDMSVKSMNALRMYHWDLEIESSEFSYTTSSKEPVTCKPIIDQVADGRLALPLKLKDYFGCPKQIRFPSLECRYRTKFEVDKLMELWLVMEPGSIYGEWHMQLNGQQINPSDFICKEVYMNSNLAVNVSSMVQSGENTLEVLVKTAQTYDGLVNPLYLCGNFGAFKNEAAPVKWKLTALPEHGCIEELEACGLPFYAGEVEYSRELEIKGDLTEEINLCIEDPSIQCSVSLSVNGHYAGVRSWSPYRWEIQKSWLRPEKNVVNLCITTSLIGLFEGQEMDTIEHKLRNI